MYIEKGGLETQRPVTMLRRSNPFGNRLMGHLINGANFLTLEGLPRVPVIGELTGTLGGVATVAGEMIGHSSVFNPDLFWGRVDRNLKSVITGKGQMTDMSPLINAWFDVIASHFKSSEMDAYAADFTLTGMNTILARMNAHSIQSSPNTELTEKMRAAYGQIYRKLVTSDSLKGGWNQIHADYSQRISSTGADVNVPNPKTTVDGANAPSGIVSMFSTDLAHGTFGVNGTFGKYLTDANGKHIFETEWENFVGSQQFLTQPIETKAKLLVEAREVFPAAFKEAKNPHLAAALQKAYVQASAIVVNRDYAIFRTRVMTKAALVEGGTTSDPNKACIDGIREELSPLLDLLADPSHGSQGLETMVSGENVVSIASAIQSQYTELLQAIDANGSPLLKGLFIEQAREKVLEALKKSKYVDLRDLYHTLIVDVDEEGVRKMYARKFADVKPEKYIEEATKELELIVGRMNDETYGLLGESNLRISADIVEETKQLIDAVKQLSPQLGTAFARAAESLLTKIDTTTVAQIAGGIATLYETIQSEFKASRALDSVISMVVDSPISVVVGEEQETARQVREEQELKPMREFWSGEDGKGGVLAVIADKRHGIGGSHANVAEKEIEYIDAVISQLSRHTAEHQRRFIKAGIDALIPAIRSGNANATLAEKLISIFKTLTESENLKDGRSQLYESWVQEPELVNELIGTMNHDVVGYGRKFNVYAELKTLFTGFINHTNLEKVADADSGTRKYNVFAAVEKQLLDAVRTVPDVKLQAELAGLYKTMSDGIGVAAMEHLALGKLMDEANTKIKALPVVSEETTDEQRQRTIEAAQSVWDSVWNNYYDIAYGERTIQGAPGSFLSTIKSNIDNFQRSLSKADDIYSVSFLESAVTSGFNFIRKSKANFDIRQRIAFDMLSLLGNSESILVKSLSDRERPRAGESRGAKRVRTLGSVQTHFIRGIVADPDLFGAFTQYIETGPAKGTRKNSGELLLCLEMLMTAKDSRLRRKSGTSAGTAIFGVLEENGINVGTSPELADFQKFEASLIASLESATRSLEATIPEYNTFYEILSAMGTFSPHMLVRLSYAIDELRPLKDTRKMSKASQEAIAKIQGMGLSPQETAYLIYTTTGKIDFGGDFAENFGADVTKIIRKGTNPEGEDNLLNLILTFRDDVCQVVDQPPGLQMYFGRDWDKGMAPHLNRAFDKYLVGFDKRIRSAIMNAPGEANEARRNIIATELLGASMIFEQFAGDSVRAKKGPHERFIQIISDIMVDSMREPGKRRYAAEVRTVADHILKNSLPNWNKELVKDFFDRMVQKINNTEYGTWIESDQWRQMCNKIVVMESDRVPTHKDHVRMTDMTGTELKGWRRDELAEIAAEATLSLLNGYTTISGPTGLRLVANVVTGKRTPEMGELTLQEVPVKDNFIMQAIRVVGWYGTPEQKEKLVPTLEKLGREDMLFVTQSAAMLPPEDIAEFINESEHVAIAMGQTITDITTQYMIALDSVTGGVKPVLQVDLDGNVVIADGVLPADSELAQVMKTHEKTLAGKVVRESGYTAAKAKADAVVAKLSTPEALENMSGTELMDSIIAYSIASTGGNEAVGSIISGLQEIAKAMAAAKTTGGEATSTQGTDAAHIDILKASMGQSLVASLAALRQQGLDAGQITEAILKEYKGLRTAVTDMMNGIVQDTGMKTTAGDVEKISQAVLKQLLTIVTNEDAMVEIAATMKKEIVEAAKREALLWNGLQEGLERKRRDIVAQEQGILYDGAMREIAQTRKNRAHYYMRTSGIADGFRAKLGTASSQLNTIVDRSTTARVTNLERSQKWLEYVSGEGDAANLSLPKRAKEYAAYCNRMLMGAAIGGVTPAFSREEAQEVNVRTVQPSRMKPTVAFLREMNGMDLPLAA